MHFRFKNIAFCRTNEIIRNLFHFPKAPNALLTLFDRIIDWMKAHRKNLKVRETRGLVKCVKLENYLNNQTCSGHALMKPGVDCVMLS